MLTVYHKIIITAIITAFAGDPLIFYLKRVLVNPHVIFAIDASGIIERTALILVIILGGNFVFLIPFIVLARALSLMGEGNFKKVSNIIKREEPAIQFQKIRLKSELAVTLLASPALGILFGIIATLF